MTADSTPVAPKPAASRAKPRVKKPVDPASMTPADLVAGPCALPDAPLAMPHQVIERPRRVAAPAVAANGAV